MAITLHEGESLVINVQLVNIVSPGSISGRVTDSVSGGSLAGVRVDLSGAASGTIYTDGSGNYGFGDLMPGSYTLTFSLADYVTQVF